MHNFASAGLFWEHAVATWADWVRCVAPDGGSNQVRMIQPPSTLSV